MRLLLVVTSRKVARRHQFDYRQVRDVSRNVASFVFADSSDDAMTLELGQLAAREPTPEFSAEFAETCEQFFACLDDNRLREIVSLRMEAYTDTEIADRLNCSRRTVQRSLEIIRRKWSRQEQAGE